MQISTHNSKDKLNSFTFFSEEEKTKINQVFQESPVKYLLAVATWSINLSPQEKPIYFAKSWKKYYCYNYNYNLGKSIIVLVIVIILPKVTHYC